MLSPIVTAFSPDILIIAMPPSPNGVAIAVIVSSNILVVNEGSCLFEFHRYGPLGIGGLFHSFFCEGNGEALCQCF